MLASTLLLLITPALPLDAPCVASADQANPPVAHQDQDDLLGEYEKRRSAAGDDTAKLWEVATWCESKKLDKQYRSILRAIVKLDDDDRKAHEALGHVYYDRQWFVSQRKAEAYQKKKEAADRKEAEKRAKEQGLVRHGDEWVHPADLPLLEKGFIKDAAGNWIDPEEQKKLEEGWVRQDLVWISPDETANVDKGLWKCGDRWLNLSDADAYHGEIGKWWILPGDHFVLYSTCTRKVAMKALVEVDQAYRDLERIFGIAPAQKPHLLVLNSSEQYGQFAQGDMSVRRFPADIAGFSSLHGAFFAELWLEVDESIPEVRYLGAGVSYWDASSDTNNMYGRFWARHAAGQSFIEKLDPSAKVIEKFIAAPTGGFPVEDFWEEKIIPKWFRYGAAAYIERYFTDPFVNPGGNPHWTREWSAENIGNRGGLDPFDRIFEFPLSLDDIPASEKLINEVGLIVAFLIDGECEPVQKEHEALKAAILKASQNPKYRKDVSKSFSKVQKAIKANEDALNAFAKF